MIKTFKYRLYPNSTQKQLINNELFYACTLYNAALQERRDTYKFSGKSLNYYDQANQLKDIRDDGINTPANFSSCQQVLRNVDKTYRAFFGRIKRGEKFGFPRFKSPRRYSTLDYRIGDGSKFIQNENKIKIQGVGKIKIKLNRPIEGQIKSVKITRKNRKYYVAFSCEIEYKILPTTNKSVGIDMGLESFAITSDGEFIGNKRFFNNSKKRLRIIQRSVARKKKGSNSRKNTIHILSSLHEKIANQRLDFHHKVSHKIINENDNIYIEDLNIKGLAAGMFAKSVHDVAWGQFFNILKYKAESAGRQVIEVNPNGTSQRCHNCGTVVKKTVYTRKHDCPVCGISIHRDLNSALEIKRLGTSLNALTSPVGESVVLEAD